MVGGCCVIWFGVCLGLGFGWFLSVFVFMCLAVFWVVLVCFVFGGYVFRMGGVVYFL